MNWLRRGFDLHLYGSYLEENKKNFVNSLYKNFFSLINFNNPPNLEEEAIQTIINSEIYKKSLLIYLYSTEFGFELGYNNAVYLIRSKLLNLSNSSSSNLFSTVKSNSFSSKHLSTILKLNYQKLIQYFDSTDAYFQLGLCYLNNLCQIEDKEPSCNTSKNCVKYYFYSAYLKNHPLASLYLGVFYQYGINFLENKINLLKANYFYSQALSLFNTNSEKISLKLIDEHKFLIEILKFSNFINNFQFLSPLNNFISYYVKNYWFK